MAREGNSSSQVPKRSDDKPRRCEYCRSGASLVWVHGHGQCANCGVNVQECCQGEHCDM